MELKRAPLTPRNRALTLGTACSDNPPLSRGRGQGQRERGIVERGGDVGQTKGLRRWQVREGTLSEGEGSSTNGEGTL